MPPPRFIQSSASPYPMPTSSLTPLPLLRLRMTNMIIALLVTLSLTTTLAFMNATRMATSFPIPPVSLALKCGEKPATPRPLLLHPENRQQLPQEVEAVVVAALPVALSAELLTSQMASQHPRDRLAMLMIVNCLLPHPLPQPP